MYCPSTERNFDYSTQNYNDPSFGQRIETDYVWLGGINTNNTNAGCHNWNNAPPAVKVTDANTTNAVLGADEATFSNGSAYTGYPFWNGNTNPYFFNHPGRSADRPANLNTLYGDGRVENLSGFPGCGLTNWSLNHSTIPLYNLYFFWAPNAP